MSKTITEAQLAAALTTAEQEITKGPHSEGPWVPPAMYANAIFAALPDTGLDVERLARAWWAADREEYTGQGGKWPEKWEDERNQTVWLVQSEAVAAEYARLTEES